MPEPEPLTIHAARVRRDIRQYYVELDDGWHRLYWQSRQAPADDATRPMRVRVAGQPDQWPDFREWLRYRDLPHGTTLRELIEHEREAAWAWVRARWQAEQGGRDARVNELRAAAVELARDVRQALDGPAVSEKWRSRLTAVDVAVDRLAGMDQEGGCPKCGKLHFPWCHPYDRPADHVPLLGAPNGPVPTDDGSALLTPDQWSVMLGWPVLDPDGWREDGKPWDEPLTKDEFIRRATASTSRPPEEHPERHCHRCGGPNISWNAPSPLWNAVMRGGTINGDEEHDGIVCPTCFAVLAEERGIARDWRLSARRVLAELETVTPSGRVWDEESWLWQEVPRTCKARYERPGGEQRGDRIVRCHLPAGHPGEHEEADTEVTWMNLSDEERAAYLAADEELNGPAAQESTATPVPQDTDVFTNVTESGWGNAANWEDIGARGLSAEQEIRARALDAAIGWTALPWVKVTSEDEMETLVGDLAHFIRDGQHADAPKEPTDAQ